MNAKVVVKVQQDPSGEAIRVEPQTPSRHCCLWCFVVIAIPWALCLEPLPAADKFRSVRDTDIKNVADLETMTADALRNVVITRTGTRLSAKEIAVAKAVYSARLNTPVEFDPSAKLFFLSRRFQSRTAAMIVVSNIGEPNAVTFFGLPGTPYSYIEESPDGTFRVVLKPDFKGIYPGEGEREGIARAMANPDDLVPVARAATASVIEPEHILTNSAVMQDADDPTREKLERAKKEFETKTAKARRDLIADIDRQMLAAQKKGQKATYDQLSEEKQAFEKDGVLPKLISTKAYRKGVTPGQKALATAFDEAVREYTKRRLLEEASRVQDEFKELAAGQSSKVTSSASLVATLAIGSSAVLRPLREASRGLTSRRASYVVPCTTGTSRSPARRAESSLSAMPSFGRQRSSAGVTSTIPTLEFARPLSIARSNGTPRPTSFSLNQTRTPRDSNRS